MKDDRDVLIERLTQENARLLANPTVKQLNDLWLREEQEAIDALGRAEQAEADLLVCQQARNKYEQDSIEWELACVDLEANFKASQQAKEWYEDANRNLNAIVTSQVAEAVENYELLTAYREGIAQVIEAMRATEPPEMLWWADTLSRLIAPKED